MDKVHTDEIRGNPSRKELKMKSINDLKNVLKVEKDKEITLSQLQEARVIYIEIAKAGFKAKKYTESNIALVVLQNAFMKLLDTEEVKDLKKTIFVNDNGSGYNAVLSREVDEAYENLLSVKIKSDTQIVKLIDDHGFYLIG